MADIPIKQAVSLDFLGATTCVNVRAAVNSSEVVIKQQLDTAISNLEAAAQGQLTVLDLDCSTNPDYPATALGGGYEVSVEGKIGGAAGLDVGVGDIIRCRGKIDIPSGNRVGSDGGDQATVGDEFYVIEGNRQQGTINTLGLYKTASQADVNTGTSSDTVVTPATLETKLNDLVNNQLVYTTNIGNGILDSFSIAHPLGTANVSVDIIENSTNEFWNVHTTATGTTVTLNFASPPSTNQFRLIVKK